MGAASFLRRAVRRWVFPKDPPPDYVFGREVLGGTRLVALDVGAAAGLPPHWQGLDGLAHVYAFEPHPQSLEELRAIYARAGHPEMFTVLPVALSGTGGKRTLYMTNVPTGTSILPVKPDAMEEWASRSYMYPMKEVPIETRTLADVLDERNEPSADLIKLDIQGAELEVLRGLGQARLDKLSMAELEVNLLEIYAGQPGIGQVIDFMRQHGLELVDVRVARTYRPRDGDPVAYQTEVFGEPAVTPTISARAWEFDAVFFREQSSVLASKDPQAVRKLVVAYCLYQYFTEAYHLVRQAHEKGLLTAEEFKQLGDLLVRWHRARKQRFHLISGLWGRLSSGARRPSPLHSERWAQYTWLPYPHQ